MIEARGLQACRQQQRRKEIRFMSHVTEWPNTEASPKSQRVKYWITGSVISHSPLIAPHTIFQPASLTPQKENTDISVTSPGKWVNGPLILRSKDQSQQGSHVCQIKKKGGYANSEAVVRAKAAGWIKKTKQRRDRGRCVDVEGIKEKPCNSLQRRTAKEKCYEMGGGAVVPAWAIFPAHHHPISWVFYC